MITSVVLELLSARHSLAQVVEAGSGPHSLHWSSSQLLGLEEQLLLLWEGELLGLGHNKLLLLRNKLLLDGGSKLLWLSNDGSCGRLGSVDDTKSFRAQFRFLMNIGLSWNLLVDIGLCLNLLMDIGDNLRGSGGCSSKTSQDLQRLPTSARGASQ